MIGAGEQRGSGNWLALTVLVAAVLVPTSCVLWFLSQAVRNEHLAVRQKLADIYREQLDRAGPQFHALWRERLRVLDALGTPERSAPALALAAQAGGFDALVQRPRDAAAPATATARAARQFNCGLI